eukprot:scaffold4782_cov76-Cyclotella_meneghiniana.AAC.5
MKGNRHGHYLVPWASHPFEVYLRYGCTVVVATESAARGGTMVTSHQTGSKSPVTAPTVTPRDKKVPGWFKNRVHVHSFSSQTAVNPGSFTPEPKGKRVIDDQNK